MGIHRRLREEMVEKSAEGKGREYGGSMLDFPARRLATSSSSSLLVLSLSLSLTREILGAATAARSFAGFFLLPHPGRLLKPAWPRRSERKREKGRQQVELFPTSDSLPEFN